MLQALFEHDVRPDLIVGTSVGAINGAFVAADPAASAVALLRAVWEELASERIFAGSALSRMGTLVRTRTHLHPREPLRDLLAAHLPVETFTELQVPFQCVAASIERAAERWFTDGNLIDAVLASSAVPGLLPPTWPWEVGLVAFEIARRHRFSADLAALPPGVTVHVLPSGDPPASGAGNLRYRDFSGVPARIEQAHIAARGYLAGVGASRSGGA